MHSLRLAYGSTPPPSLAPACMRQHTDGRRHARAIRIVWGSEFATPYTELRPGNATTLSPASLQYLAQFTLTESENASEPLVPDIPPKASRDSKPHRRIFSLYPVTTRRSKVHNESNASTPPQARVSHRRNVSRPVWGNMGIMTLFTLYWKET